ncbi:hypothetical protein PT974_05465 [Cladobotryum mycophilum]|uniref:Uncharacterized protein n=1 Tax=Cladobotryum mycophilum TaxID=491253 RepID=A0ABR0SIV9_9HYPO
MSVLDKMLRRQSRTEEPLRPGAAESQAGSESGTVASVLVASALPSAAPPASIATLAPLPQDAARSYPQYQSQMQNTGMEIGATVGVLADGNAGSATNDMLAGGL